jgi:hypothetical protein
MENKFALFASKLLRIDLLKPIIYKDDKKKREILLN